MASSISIESLQATLTCLQGEKSCLEQKLRSMKAQKSSVQDQTSCMTAKKHQVAEINAKMKETIDVAKHKVEHTLQQQNAVQKMVDEKRQAQKELRDEIEREKERGMAETHEFEEKLSTLANMFITARRYYTPENLENELKALGEQQIEMAENTGKCETNMQSMLEQLEQLKIDKETSRSKANSLPIPADQQEAIIKDLEGCTKDIETNMELYSQKQEVLKLKQEELQRTVEELEAKLTTD